LNAYLNADHPEGSIIDFKAWFRRVRYPFLRNLEISILLLIS
jgi:hypothetical protein